MTMGILVANAELLTFGFGPVMRNVKHVATLKKMSTPSLALQLSQAMNNEAEN